MLITNANVILEYSLVLLIFMTLLMIAIVVYMFGKHYKMMKTNKQYKAYHDKLDELKSAYIKHQYTKWQDFNES